MSAVNLDSADGSAFKIGGFQMEIASNGEAVMLLGDGAAFCSTASGGAGTALWQDGALHFTICPDQVMKAGRLYWLTVPVTNPDLARDSITPFVQASGTATFKPANMSVNQGPLLGVARGAQPLRVVLPTFTTLQAVQSNPLALSEQNKIVITRALPSSPTTS